MSFGGAPTALWQPPEGWGVTDAPTNAWGAVACSADGSRILAATRLSPGSGNLWSSTNSGTTWLSNNVPAYDWFSVAVSADGNRYLALGGRGINVSTNAGTSWEEMQPAPDVHWNHVASSADGARLVAGGFTLVVESGGLRSQGVVYTSADSGTTWKLSFRTAELFSYETTYVREVASSADGSGLAAIDIGPMYTGSLFTSSDGGLTWVTNRVGDGSSTTSSFLRLTCSADGQTLVLCRYYDPPGVFISRDWGSTWVQASTNRTWSVTCSADGLKLSTLDANGLVHTSLDGGATWTRNSLPYHTDTGYLAASADGSRLLAAVNGGGVYVSQTVPAPILRTRVSNERLVLSWIVPTQPFLLQQNPDLASANWVELSGRPSLNHSNLHFELQMPMTATGSMFYRPPSPN